MSEKQGLELRSLVNSDGRLRLWLEDVPVQAPAADEVVVRVEGAPLNPSDLLVLLGPVDLSSLHASGTATRPVVEGVVPEARLPAIRGRLDRALPVGNEGAGTIVEAGSDAHELLGRSVAIRASTGTYSTYQTVKAAHCLQLPDGVSPRQGAAAFVNPLTALGIVETMRREGHKAVVHTAAASSLGQMLNRLCLKDGVSLVNIVRSPEQVALLREQGAAHVLNSNDADFRETLVDALEETGATLAFDAIGGGKLASTILEAMETVASRHLTAYSRYGSPVHKQVYIYGALDPGPKIIAGAIGTAWGVGGWLMTWFYQRIGAADAQRLRRRAMDELTSTFVTHFTADLDLAEALSLDAIRAYSRRATGAKYLITPQKN
jgi:NADPH:quinone reductase